MGVRTIRDSKTANVMAAMKFVVKYFAEIAIKSKPVRQRFVTHLVGAICFIAARG